jgi:hypothetical protein
VENSIIGSDVIELNLDGKYPTIHDNNVFNMFLRRGEKLVSDLEVLKKKLMISKKENEKINWEMMKMRDNMKMMMSKLWLNMEETIKLKISVDYDEDELEKKVEKDESEDGKDSSDEYYNTVVNSLDIPSKKQNKPKINKKRIKCEKNLDKLKQLFSLGKELGVDINIFCEDEYSFDLNNVLNRDKPSKNKNKNKFNDEESNDDGNQVDEVVDKKLRDADLSESSRVSENTLRRYAFNLASTYIDDRTLIDVDENDNNSFFYCSFLYLFQSVNPFLTKNTQLSDRELKKREVVVVDRINKRNKLLDEKEKNTEEKAELVYFFFFFELKLTNFEKRNKILDEKEREIEEEAEQV